MGLLRVDTVRLLVRPRFYLVGLAISLVAALYLQAYADTDYGLARNACHATTQCLAEALTILLPLAAGVAADLLALDRSTGFIVVLLSRSGSRAKYVLAKAVATALVVAMGTGLVYALTFLVAAVRFPLWPVTPADGASLFAGKVFRAHPLGYVLLRWVPWGNGARVDGPAAVALHQAAVCCQRAPPGGMPRHYLPAGAG